MALAYDFFAAGTIPRAAAVAVSAVEVEEARSQKTE
jgi:hypothetical protein